MSNIYPSILEKLAALNIDIYHYEDIVRCYALAKLNIEHSGNPDYTDGIHSAEFDTEVSRYQLLHTRQMLSSDALRYIVLFHSIGSIKSSALQCNAFASIIRYSACALLILF